MTKRTITLTITLGDNPSYDERPDVLNEAVNELTGDVQRALTEYEIGGDSVDPILEPNGLVASYEWEDDFR